ncbi:hypothetical protein BKA67DRAFT_500268, partial [Truncatella angustata]
MAYISNKKLKHKRRYSYKIVRKNTNIPVDRLCKLRSKKLAPGNSGEDPYLVATIVSLAQSRVYAENLSSNVFTPRDVVVQLITFAVNRRAFVVYRATVTSAFLKMFDQPHEAPMSRPELTIEYRFIPVWPVLRLQDRFKEVLGDMGIG